MFVLRKFSVVACCLISGILCLTTPTYAIPSSNDNNATASGVNNKSQACQNAMSEYYVKCGDSKSQCTHLTRCKDMRRRCPDDISTTEGCTSFNSCVEDYFTELRNNGEHHRFICSYRAALATNAQQQCENTNFQEQRIANSCPGFSAFLNSSYYKDQAFTCGGHQEMYLVLHGQCEVAKQNAQTACQGTLPQEEFCPAALQQVGTDSPAAVVTNPVNSPEVENGSPSRWDKFISYFGFSDWSPSDASGNGSTAR